MPETKLKNFFWITFAVLSMSVEAQMLRTFKSYKFLWDSAAKKNFVLDTLSGNKFLVDFEYNGEGACYFQHGLVYVRTGDMKGLTDLKGRKLLKASHFINFNEEAKIISAWVCTDQAWIFLSFDGDTLSYGKTKMMNYVPELGNELNPAYILDPVEKHFVYGYLSKKAKWVIEPRYDIALEFINGKAKVKIGGKWGAIDQNGKIIVKATHKTEYFELK